MTLKQKSDVVQQVRHHVPYRKLANDFNCSIGQISNISVNQTGIEKCFEENLNPKAKRVKSAPNHDINEAVWNWFRRVSGKGIPLSGKNLVDFPVTNFFNLYVPFPYFASY